MRTWPAIRQRFIAFACSMHAKVLAACFLSALIASMVAMLITYTASVSVIQRNAREQVTAMIANSHRQLDSYATEIENLAMSLSVDKENIHKVLTNGLRPIGHAWFEEWKTTRQFLEQMAASQGAIYRIDVIGPDKLYSTDAMAFFSGITQETWETYQDLPQRWNYTAGDTSGLIFLRSIWVGREKIGIVRIWFDTGTIAGLFGEESLPQGHVFILTPEGEFLLNPVDGQRSILDTRYAAALDPALHNELIHIDGRSYLVVRIESGTTGLITLALVSNDVLLRDSMQLRNLTTTMLVILVLISLVGAWLVSRRIIKNLRQLEEAMLRVEAGDLTVRVNIPGRNEVAHLGRVFQTMMQRIQDLFARVSEKERERHLAELRALQAQIGPHFVCNTLSNIKYLAALQDAHNIEELAQALAEMMRVMLGNIDEDITVGEEVHLLRNYVLIQKYRFLDHIQVDFQVEEAALDALIPKLILQPILENAYLHGLSDAQEGVIVVRVAMEDDLLVCEIADDGAGLTPEQLERMLSDAYERPGRAMSGMGIYNVRQRIMLRWPETGRMEISSRPGVFTSVRLVMPLVCGVQPAGEEAAYAHPDR